MRKMLVLLFLLIVSNCLYAEVTFGNPEGRIILIEYFDYNCPVCRTYATVIDTIAKQNHDVKVIARVVPILLDDSQVVDRAVLASFYQDKFQTLQAAILNAPFSETIPPRAVFFIAKKAGLNVKTLYQDMDRREVSAQLLENLKGYQTTHETRVPIVQFYLAGNAKLLQQFVGAQSVETLQATVNILRQTP